MRGLPLWLIQVSESRVCLLLEATSLMGFFYVGFFLFLHISGFSRDCKYYSLIGFERVAVGLRIDASDGTLNMHWVLDSAVRNTRARTQRMAGKDETIEAAVEPLLGLRGRILEKGSTEVREESATSGDSDFEDLNGKRTVKVKKRMGEPALDSSKPSLSLFDVGITAGRIVIAGEEKLIVNEDKRLIQELGFEKWKDLVTGGGQGRLEVLIHDFHSIVHFHLYSLLPPTLQNELTYCDVVYNVGCYYCNRGACLSSRTKARQSSLCMSLHREGVQGPCN